MLINVGGLWDRPIPIADEMSCLPSVYTDIVFAETFPSYNIEAYQSHEECTYFKNFSAGTNLESDLEYGVRAMDFIEDVDEICPKKQLKSRSAITMDNQYAFIHGVSSESKGRKRADGIQMSENILCAHTSKSLRVRSSATKDRHSKVSTAKGLRDTRVRLSLSTAYKFYEVHHRLGYKHPTKALDWLLNKAQAAIDELPQSSYVSEIKCSLCDSISRSGTSLATDQVISTYSHTTDGCSTNSSVNTSRSGEEGKEEISRSCGLMNLGIPRLVSDPKEMTLFHRHRL